MRLPVIVVVASALCFVTKDGTAEWIVYAEDFDGLNGGSSYVSAEPALGDEWSFYKTNEGRSRIYDWGGSRGGVLILDDYLGNNTYSLNEAILTVNLLGYTDVTMQFSHYDADDEEHGIGTSSYVNHKNADGVSVSSDGTNWYPLVNFSQSNGSWKSYLADISALVDAKPLLSLSSNFQIKLQQYDNYSHGSDGRKFDSIVIKGEQQAPVPEPATATLFGIGMIGLAVSRRKWLRKSA
jgi:hypothetical protein